MVVSHSNNYTNYRDTVMYILALMDPEGTRQRASRKLKRRIYRSKVNFLMELRWKEKSTLNVHNIVFHTSLESA